MTGLSVAIITLNEEEHIERCIRSVIGIADEIVVVDSFSTDNTKAICASYHTVFIENPFPGFIEQKNFALSKARYSHVLSLDADEYLSEEMAAYVLSEKQKGFPKDAYGFNRLNFYCGQWIKHGTAYPDRKLRLIKAGTAAWGGENPHDKLLPAVGITPHFQNVDILHYIFQRYSEHLAQMEKFSTIAARALFSKQKKPSYFKAVINPFWAFFHSYVLRRGFLDGWNGYMIARFNAIHTFLKYSKLIELYKKAG